MSKNTDPPSVSDTSEPSSQPPAREEIVEQRTDARRNNHLMHEGPYNFGYALLHMVRYKRKIFREGWNGKGMFLYIVRNPQPALVPGLPDVRVMQTYIAMFTAQQTVVPWVASQSDLLIEDWYILDEEVLNRPMPVPAPRSWT